MFWSGNYTVVRELNKLLNEENVTLTQVLEADDILHECQGDNKALMQFLTKPKILAELITLITEEPPKNVELASQYRHASIACEVLTSHLSTLSDHLSMDVVQMNRLCDFINKEPPLNPLLASYFSKTVEMLLERSPKQDWYLYHIVCLRVLDFFKSRRDFLPNLLRHISTSAIADTFKYFIRLDDLFNKIIMEWFEEHQFLECLIQIICGTYVPEPLTSGGAAAGAVVEGVATGVGSASPDQPEKGQLEPSEKAHANHTPHDPDKEGVQNNVEVAKEPGESPGGAEGKAGEGERGEQGAEAEARRRVSAIAAANAAALLCDLILSGCAGDGYNTRARTSWALVSRLAGAGAARLLAGMFTAPPHARPAALVHGAHVLLALLDHEPLQGGECESERTSVEMAVAPHLPLLHQALLEEPEGDGGRVGLARLQVAALLAHLATSQVQEVCSTMVTLGTPGVVLDMMFRYENNNFLHAHAHALVSRALDNRLYRTHYARHLLVECDLLTRLMDAFEDNENKIAGRPRSAYMGHVVQLLRCVGRALAEDAAVAALLAPATLQRYHALLARRLHATLQHHDTPLGGYYPSEDTYEFNLPGVACGGGGGGEGVGGMDEGNDLVVEDHHEMLGGLNDPTEFHADELDMDDNDKMERKSAFLELARQRFGDDMWEDSPSADADVEAEDCPIDQVREVLAQPSPWESSPGGESGGGGEGWAHFDAPAPSWPYRAENTSQDDLEQNMRNLHMENEFEKLDGSSVELANKLLTAMSSMPPHLVAHLVPALATPALDQDPTQGLDSNPHEFSPADAKRSFEDDFNTESETRSENKIISEPQKGAEQNIDPTLRSEAPPTNSEEAGKDEPEPSDGQR